MYFNGHHGSILVCKFDFVAYRLWTELVFQYENDKSSDGFDSISTWLEEISEHIVGCSFRPLRRLEFNAVWNDRFCN